ncbi:hypothetical protein V9T40_002948 [Parthenolecanium corni]|uniref:Uncharacterized protein n=1 Tax=Parthenolecanium corni TaxID=536013 RepID=A0AAN9THM6_9HEMI
MVGAIFDNWVARLRTCNAVSHALPHSRPVIHLALGRPEKGVSQRATSEAKEPRAKSRRQKTSERRRVASWACGSERIKFGYACNLYTRDKLLYFYILTAAAAPSSSSSSSSSHSQSSILNPHSSFVILSPFSQHTAYSAPQPPATRADPTRCGAPAPSLNGSRFAYTPPFSTMRVQLTVASDPARTATPAASHSPIAGKNINGAWPPRIRLLTPPHATPPHATPRHATPRLATKLHGGWLNDISTA